MLVHIAVYFYAFGIFLLLVSPLYGFTEYRAINYAKPDVTTTFTNINYDNDIINDCINLITLSILFIGAGALIDYFEKKSY